LVQPQAKPLGMESILSGNQGMVIIFPTKTLALMNHYIWGTTLDEK
jgi:hypothetical protein